MSNKIKLGWAEVDITPTEKINLAGQFFERITNEVESPITMTALAVESGDEQMILCSCDLVAVSYNLMDLAREKMAGKLPIDPRKVIASAIHSHTSYTYTRKNRIPGSTLNVLSKLLPEDMTYETLTGDETAMDPDVALEFLAGKLAEVAVAAWNNRAEGYYAGAFGRAAVGMNRRVVYDDATAKMWGDTNLANFKELEGGNDSGMELIFTYDKNKKLTGVVANIACPAQVVEHRSYISSDYWGKVKENLRKVYGADFKVLGLCAAAGDQCPRDMIRWVEPETPIDDPNIKRSTVLPRRADPSMFDVSGLKLVGKRISNEIQSVFEEYPLELKDESILTHEVLDMDFPLRRVTITEYEKSLKAIQDFARENKGKSINFEDNARLHVQAGTIARYEVQQNTDVVTEEIHVIRFGDIAIATSPFELFLNYGNQIRARSKATQTFLVQLCCGSCGYLPTEKAEQGSHYSAYVSSGFTGHEGGELLVRETLTHINKMFD